MNALVSEQNILQRKYAQNNGAKKNQWNRSLTTLYTIQQLQWSTKFPFRNDYRTFCWQKYILWILVFWDMTLCQWVSGCQCFIFLLWRWTN